MLLDCSSVIGPKTILHKIGASAGINPRHNKIVVPFEKCIPYKAKPNIATTIKQSLITANGIIPDSD